MITQLVLRSLTEFRTALDITAHVLPCYLSLAVASVVSQDPTSTLQSVTEVSANAASSENSTSVHSQGKLPFLMSSSSIP